MSEQDSIAKRVVALGLLGIALVLLTAIIVTPVAGWILGYGAERRAAEANYLRYLEASANLSEFQDRIDQLEDDSDLMGLLLDPMPEERASAWLQGQLRQMGQEAGANVTSSRSAPLGNLHGLQRVSVQIQLRSTLAELEAFLVLVEDAHPLLIVDEMSIRSQNAGGRIITAEPVLTSTLVIGGLMNGGGE